LASSGTGLATAYGPPWGGIQGGGTTATGIDLHNSPHKLIVAVDPKVIPLGSRLKIWPNPFGDPNLIFTAADTGGAIHSPHLFDFYDWRGRKTQLGFGYKRVKYQIVGRGDPKSAGTLAGGADQISPSATASGNAASSGGGDVAGLLAGPLLRALLYTGLIGAGAWLAFSGTRQVAHAGSSS
jgi:3D (Asp-Asp-Asp) domain-containing protein